MVDAREVDDLLEERPELEPAIRELLERDEPWEFDDIDVDSGTFGELVSHGVVQKHDGAYEISDRAAIRRALAGDIGTRRDEAESGLSIETLDALSSPHSLVLLGAVAFVILVRLLTAPSVFTEGAVVLSGNDPYYYRFWVESLLENSQASLSTLPGEVAKGESLTVVMLWTGAALLGGTTADASLLLSVYPVVTAAISALLVFALARYLTPDVRIALASVVLLAIVPGHVIRTSLGYADHHAFDYLWLAVTTLGVTLTTVERVRTRLATTLAAVVTVAAGVSSQALAWEAGPLLLFPVVVYLLVRPPVDIFRDQSPLVATWPLLAGLGLGAAVTAGVHVSLGWQSALVTAAPALLFVGGVGTVAAGELTHRLDAPVTALGIVEVVGTGATAYILATRFPSEWAFAVRKVDESLFRTDAIAETGGLFGSSFGWLLLFGFILLLALPSLLIVTRRAVEKPRWLFAVVATWTFLGLAAVQVRFVGQLALLLSVFAGDGFVRLAAWVDILDRGPPSVTNDWRSVSLTTPDRQTIQSLVLLFLLVGSLSFVQIPVKNAQLTIPEEQYQTAEWIDDYEQEVDFSQRRSYVLSEWGRNRLYNYALSGDAESYGYARKHFVPFISATNATRWYERLYRNVGFIVVTEAVVGNESTMGTRLYRHGGTRVGDVPGLAHFRLLYESPSGEYRVFTVVRGALVRGSAPPNTTVTVETTASFVGGEMTYTREVQTGPDGRFSIRLPYPGTYSVGNRTVVVSEEAVYNSTVITVEDENSE